MNRDQHAHSHKHKFTHKHGENILSIDVYAHESGLRQLNSGFKTACAAGYLILGIASDSVLVSAMLVFAMMWLTVAKGRLALHDYVRLLLLPFTFILLSSIALLLDFSRHSTGNYEIYLGFCYIYTTKANMMLTIRLVCKALGAVSCLYMLTLSTPVSEIIRVLRKCKVPQLVTELMNLIYRFIFILMDVQYRMTVSARARLGFDSVKTSWYSFGSILSNLFIVSMKKAGIYYDALEARCYDGELCFLEENYPVEKKHIAYAILFAAGLLCLWYLEKQMMQ